MTVYHKNSSSFILTGFDVLGKKTNSEAERVAQNVVLEWKERTYLLHRAQIY